MSPPAVIDLSSGQVSSFESSSGFCFHDNNMNSSSSDSRYGFSNFNETNPISGFNSPPLVVSRKPGSAGSGSNLSRPRLVKMRKQASSHNPRSTSPAPASHAGFNRFQGLSEPGFGKLSSVDVAKGTFLFGANRSDNSTVILDDMSKSKIYNDKDYANAIGNNSGFNSKVDGSESMRSVVDESEMEGLPEEINKLKIEGSGDVGSPTKYQDVDSINNGQFTNKYNNNVVVELENETNTSFVFGNDSKAVDSFPFDDFQSFGTSSSLSRSEKKVDFTFTSKLDDNTGTPNVEFKTHNMKGNLFSGENSIFEGKESAKDSRSKKKIGKLRKPITGQSRPQDLDFTGRRNPEYFEAFLPMAGSPYQKTLYDNYSRGTSETPEEGYQTYDQNNVANESHIMNSNVTTVDDLLASTKDLDTDSDGKCSLAKDEVPKPHFNEISDTEISKSETISSFTFGASSYSQCQPLPETRQHKKKNRLKTGQDSYGSTLDANNPYVSSSSVKLLSGNSSILSPGKAQKLDISALSSKKKDNSKPVNEPGLKHETGTSSASNAAQEACDKWRLRGNQAYSNGDLAKAEDYYTQGLNSVSQSEKSRSCLMALMLCYSNRAAARISRGRMREALKDCLMAASIDPNFLKVQVRAAHCYLAIGEVENATQQFMKCLQSGSDVPIDRKLFAEASEGLDKAQKVLDCIKQYTELLQRRTSDALECALSVIDEALQISTYSEKLLQMKADALLVLRRYEQVIQMCEQQTLGSADEIDSSTSSSSRLWRSSMIFKSYFHLGKLDEALEFINKQENSGHITQRAGSMSLESVIPLVDTVRELLSHKEAGNEAYKKGRHIEAVEHYSAALSSNVESRPFAAICFCNRAAAYRALAQIIDAIADCSLAIALDPYYLKAISRRASLYEMIRGYGQAAVDLERLMVLLTAQVEGKGNLTGVIYDKSRCMNELRQTQLRLSNVEEESRKKIPLNMYLILGIESAAAASEVKKAYRKAALKHHPDKAAQALGRSDNGDDGVWKEIAENVHRDADRLFKMIGEAYAILYNPSKRSRYDLDEETRNEANRFARSSPSNIQNSIFERSGSSSRGQWQDSWRPYVPEKTGSSSYRYSSYS